MKQIALLSLSILATLLWIQGGTSFSSSDQGLTVDEVGPEWIPVTIEPKQVELPPALDLEEAEKIYDASNSRFRKDLDAAQRVFEKSVHTAFKQTRSRLFRQLRWKLDEKITRTAVLRQTVRMAADILSSGPSRAERWMKQNFEVPLRPVLEQLSARISKAQHQLTLDRKAALSAFETRFLEEIPNQLEASAQASHLIGGEVLGGLSQGANKAALGLGLTTASTAVFMSSDFADLKKAPVALKNLSGKASRQLANVLNSRQLQKILGKRLAPIARRYAQKIAASGIAVAADGPLPIGDLIAVAVTGISSAWTLYEVWDLAYGAKRDILRGANKNFVALEDRIRVDMVEPERRKNQKLQKSVEALRTDILEKLLKL
jgi:hypothetical protein